MVDVFLVKLFPEDLPKEGKVFAPIARYYPAMDFLLYLKEDCSYVADRVSTFFTVLRHPQEDRLVGIKLKGCKFLFNQARRQFDLKEGDFLPLIKLLEIAFVSGIGETMMDASHRKKLEEMFQKAYELADSVEVTADELRRAA